MSYILEALRRAERERDTGKAPSVESLNRAAPAFERSRVPRSVWALAIATAVIACAALAVLLWPHRRAATPAPARPSTVIAEPASAPATADRPAGPAVTAIEPGPTAIEDRDDVVSLDDLTGDDADTATSPPPAAGSPAPDAADAAGVPAADAGAGTPPAPLSSPPVEPSSPLSAGSDQNTIAVPPGVTVLREMPAPYREQFPVSTLDVHVYDPDPAKRWIMVDGQRYREGSTLASGPQIAEIVEGGVIFEYQGARVLLPVR